MTHQIITGSYERGIVLKILLNCNNVEKCRGQKGGICNFALSLPVTWPMATLSHFAGLITGGCILICLKKTGVFLHILHTWALIWRPVLMNNSPQHCDPSPNKVVPK